MEQYQHMDRGDNFKRKYAIKLSCGQRQFLEQFIKSKSKKATQPRIQRAKLLLSLDENNAEPLSLSQIAKNNQSHTNSVFIIRKRFVIEGLERVLYGNYGIKPRPPAKARVVTAEVEAYILKLANSSAPLGRKRWSSQAIADRLVLDGVVDSIGRSSVRLVLARRQNQITSAE